MVEEERRTAMGSCLELRKSEGENPRSKTRRRN
jgi:hypothetical protein